jgi:Adenylylsulfate kinase and related kinases
VRGARPQGPLREGAGGDDPHFTGISDPYEEPFDAEVSVDTTTTTAAEAAQVILERLVTEGYLPAQQW